MEAATHETVTAINYIDIFVEKSRPVEEEEKEEENSLTMFNYK